MFIVLITLLAITAIGWGIAKNIPAYLLLLVVGAILISIALTLEMSAESLINESTGWGVTDFFIKLKETMSYRFAGLGLIIMCVGGYSSYVFSMGASQKMVAIVVSLFASLKKPYILLACFFLIAVFLNMFVTSATGIGLLLMVTMYPVLVKLGVSRLAAVGMIATSAVWEFGPVQTHSIVAAEYAGITARDYFVSYQLLVGLLPVFVMAMTHYAWQKYMDKRLLAAGHHEYFLLNDVQHESMQQNEEIKVPNFYAILPTLPLVMVLLFSGTIIAGIKLDLVSSILASVAIVLFLEVIVKRGDVKKAFEGLNGFVQGMQSMVPVVLLIVGAQVFIEGLKMIGSIDYVIDAASELSSGTGIIIFIMVLIVSVTTFIMGSGNASFLALVQMTPAIGERFGLNLVTLLLPMQFAASLWRATSPIAAVVIATAGMANVTPIEVVKRTSVPIVVGFVAMCIMTNVMFY